VLGRSLEAAASDRIRIANFGYVWTAEGWFYVAAVIYLFSRRVVGWSMSKAMTAQLDSQYTREQLQRLMANHGVACSRAGRATSGTTRRTAGWICLSGRQPNLSTAHCRWQLNENRRWKPRAWLAYCVKTVVGQ
jgi:transposase InsO family protein